MRPNGASNGYTSWRPAGGRRILSDPSDPPQEICPLSFSGDIRASCPSYELELSGCQAGRNTSCLVVKRSQALPQSPPTAERKAVLNAQSVPNSEAAEDSTLRHLRAEGQVQGSTGKMKATQSRRFCVLNGKAIRGNRDIVSERSVTSMKFTGRGASTVLPLHGCSNARRQTFVTNFMVTNRRWLII